MCVWRGLERVSLHKCSCTCREELGITSVWTVGADSHGHGHASHAGRGPSRSDFAFGLVPAVPLLFSGVNLCFPFTWVSWLWPSSLGACPSAVARGLVPGGRPLLRVLVEPRVAPTRPRCPASRSSHWTTRGFRAFTGSSYFMDLEWFKNVVMFVIWCVWVLENWMSAPRGGVALGASAGRLGSRRRSSCVGAARPQGTRPRSPPPGGSRHLMAKPCSRSCNGFDSRAVRMYSPFSTLTSFCNPNVRFCVFKNRAQ